MFARLIIVQMKIGSHDEAKKLYQESVVPTAKSQRGYYQEQISKFEEFFSAPPVREGYEVSVQD